MIRCQAAIIEEAIIYRTMNLKAQTAETVPSKEILLVRGEGPAEGEEAEPRF